MDEVRLREMMAQVNEAAYGWALQCCDGRREEARDLLQSVYLMLLEGRARFDGRSTFKTWLFAVIRRVGRKRRWSAERWLRRLTEMVVPSLVGSQEQRLYEDELEHKLRGLLDRLSPRQREVLHLVFYQELTVEQASAVMGIAVGSARTHYERGKARLLKEIAESGIEHEYRSGRLEDPAAL